MEIRVYFDPAKCDAVLVYEEWKPLYGKDYFFGHTSTENSCH